MIAMTPQEFQVLALGWLAAASVVLGALLTLVLRYWPQVIEIKTRLDALHDRVNRQGARQDTQATTLNQVALATNAPTQPPASVN